jgi:hypothetical protein
MTKTHALKVTRTRGLPGMLLLFVPMLAPLACSAAPTDVAAQESALTTVTWEYDTFDDLPVGPIHGEDGWNMDPGVPGPVVFPNGPWGNYLKVTGIPDENVIFKSVPPQSSGTATFDLMWRPNINVKATTIVDIGVGDKFSFHTGMGVSLENHTSDWRTIIPPSRANLNNWFAIHCVFGLPNGPLSVFVNGAPVLTGYPLPDTSPISELSIAGVEAPGAITIDNIIGQTMQ